MIASGLLIVLFSVVVLCSVRCEDDPELAHHVDELYTRLARFQAKAGVVDFAQRLIERDGEPDAFEAMFQKVKEGEKDSDESSLDAVTYDVMKLQWRSRTDGQRQLPDGTCDKLMAEYEAWSEMDGVVRNIVSECMTQRLRVDALRAVIPSLYWIPQDLLTNKNRPIVFATDFAISATVLRQFAEDQYRSLRELYNPSYAEKWRHMSLNVSHYASMCESEDALDAFRRKHTLADYMQWNDANQQAAVEWLYGQGEPYTKRTFTANDITMMTGFFEILAKNMLPF